MCVQPEEENHPVLAFPNKLQLAPTIKGSEQPCPKIPRGTQLAT